MRDKTTVTPRAPKPSQIANTTIGAQVPRTLAREVDIAARAAGSSKSAFVRDAVAARLRQIKGF